MNWILSKFRDLLPNRPYGKTAKDVRPARLVDLDKLVDETNDIFSDIKNEITNLQAQPSAPLVASPFIATHYNGFSNQYTIGTLVYYNGNVYRCIANNDSITPTNSSYWLNLGPGYQTVQSPSDWGATGGNTGILNKPTFKTVNSQSILGTGDIPFKTVNGQTITGTGDITVSGGTVNYGNVYFVDGTNGNDATAVINDFTKPYATVVAAYNAAKAASPTAINRALIHVRKGNYFNETLVIASYVDVYSDAGVTYKDTSKLVDNNVSAEMRFLGHAKFEVTNSTFQIVTITGSSTRVAFECDEIRALGGMFEVQNGASLYFKARRVDADASGFYNSAYCRGGGTIVVEISEEYKSYAQLFKFVQFSGKMYATCPRMFLKDGGGIPANFKQGIMCDPNAGGEAIINGNLYADPAGTSYYGNNSGMITRWGDSWMTLKFTGNIYAENQMPLHAQGSSAASRTIIEGDVRTNLQVAYIAQNSRVVFRNGTLMNWNTEASSVSGQYPIITINQSPEVHIENCHLQNLGTGGFAAFNKLSTTSNLNIYNCVYSGLDAVGTFIKNSAAGTPINLVRIHNTRSTKPLDTNIMDILSPSGFIQDPNITAIIYT